MSIFAAAAGVHDAGLVEVVDGRGGDPCTRVVMGRFP
jgi:hypothetical protein